MEAFFIFIEGKCEKIEWTKKAIMNLKNAVKRETTMNMI